MSFSQEDGGSSTHSPYSGPLAGEEYGQFERDLSGEIINLILKVVLYKGASCVYILTLDRLRERSKNSTVTRS